MKEKRKDREIANPIIPLSAIISAAVVSYLVISVYSKAKTSFESGVSHSPASGNNVSFSGKEPLNTELGDIAGANQDKLGTKVVFPIKPATGDRHFEKEPPVMLWSWENPDDLSKIDAKKIGVAYLSKTITLKNDTLRVRGRLQPLKLPSDPYVIAVVRIEVDDKNPPLFSNLQMQSLVKEATIGHFGNYMGIQIDFDAKKTEREFYRSFLQNLRKAVAAEKSLSMTALSSWSLRDNWLGDMPVDEVVPMFFSMGSARAEAIAELKANRLAPMSMQESLGFSVAEPDVFDDARKLSRHVYLFASHGWNSDEAKAFLAKVMARMNK